MPKCHHPGCDKECKTPNGVKSHGAAVHRRATWRCTSCNSIFKSEVDLQDHKSKYPNGACRGDDKPSG
ncbi:hypothetical protein NL676_022023 [Syzygium grande]|nr:hypothetical protein NL676_022023 [Syzygium grande]